MRRDTNTTRAIVLWRRKQREDLPNELNAGGGVVNGRETKTALDRKALDRKGDKNRPHSSPPPLLHLPLLPLFPFSPPASPLVSEIVCPVKAVTKQRRNRWRPSIRLYQKHFFCFRYFTTGNRRKNVRG